MLAAFAVRLGGNRRGAGVAQQEVSQGASRGGAVLRVLGVNTVKAVAGTRGERYVGIESDLLKIGAKLEHVTAALPGEIVIDLDDAALLVDGQVAGAGGRGLERARTGGSDGGKTAYRKRGQAGDVRQVGSSNDAVLVEEPRHLYGLFLARLLITNAGFVQ